MTDEELAFKIDRLQRELATVEAVAVMCATMCRYNATADPETIAERGLAALRLLGKLPKEQPSYNPAERPDPLWSNWQELRNWSNWQELRNTLT